MWSKASSTASVDVRNPSPQFPLVAVVTLTAAQIRTLASSPVVLVAKPGAGKIIVPVGMFFILNFGTSRFRFTTGGSDTISPRYLPSSDNFGGNQDNLVGVSENSYAWTGFRFGPYPTGSSGVNEDAGLLSASNYTNGPISTATLGAGGAGYAVNDTGTISTGSGDATYTVLTVGGAGAVVTFSISGAGTSYATGNGVATATGGAQPGIGVGFTVNITAVATGNGTLKVTTFYTILPVP